MTTSELIKFLAKIDPDGNTPVCIDNHQIINVIKIPSYIEGPLEELKIVQGKPQSAKLMQSGMKVCIKYFAIEDGIMEDPDFLVDMSEIHSMASNVLKQNYDKIRLESKKILELKEKRILDE